MRKIETEPPSTEDVEIKLILQAIYLKYGYDFRDYAHSSVKRQLLKRMESSKLESLLAVLEKVLYKPDFVTALVQDFSNTFSEMFRDPSFYRAVRERVFPILREQQGEIKIWHAGCAGGEEVHSLAIVLKEE
jgi:chemotaxis protein methyltransferase CheR